MKSLLNLLLLVGLGVSIYSIQKQADFLPQAAASQSSSTVSTFKECSASRADINGDLKVNILDFSRISACYGKTSSEKDINDKVCALADLNRDGIVNEVDETCVQYQFGKQYTSNCTACRADVNQDHGVNGLDVSQLVPCWGKSGTDKNAYGQSCNQEDIDKNGIVGEGDVNCIASQFLQTCSDALYNSN